MSNEIAISEFKARCLELLGTLYNQDQKTIIVTKRDRPIAIVTAIDEQETQSIFGIFASKGVIKGDIIGPISNL